MRPTRSVSGHGPSNSRSPPRSLCESTEAVGPLSIRASSLAIRVHARERERKRGEGIKKESRRLEGAARRRVGRRGRKEYGGFFLRAVRRRFEDGKSLSAIVTAEGGGEWISGLRESEIESLGFGKPFAGLA